MKQLMITILIISANIVTNSQWQKISNENVGVTGKIVVHNSAVFSYGDNGSYFLLRSTDNGGTWVNLASNAPAEFIDIYSFNGRLYAAWLGGIYVSDNVGDSWSGLSSVTVTGNGAIWGFTSDTSTLYAFSNRKSVFKSVDGGTTWQEIIINDSRNLTIVNFAAIGNFYVVIIPNLGAMVSEDGGQTWADKNPAGTALSGIYARNGVMYGFSFGAGLFRYNMNSKTWEAIKNGINDKGSLQVPKSMAASGNIVFASSLGIITNELLYYSSSNNGDTWTKLNMEGMPSKNYNGALAANSINLFCYYYGIFDIAENIGVYKTTISNATSVNDANSAPGKFILFQNYPNPFNPATSIRYNLTSESQVLLRIYDMLGNEVAELINDIKPAGEYLVEFSSKNLSSGIYFYKLSTKSYTETKSMVLLK